MFLIKKKIKTFLSKLLFKRAKEELHQMPNYGEKKYWDDRYEKAGRDAVFDWLESYATLRRLLE